MRPRSHSFSSVRSESVIATHTPGYICSICKNSELLRSSTLDASIETLMGKLNSANEQFSESMSKIESLSLNVRHFLLKNDDATDKYQKSLASINDGIENLSTQTKSLENFIAKNEGPVKALDNSYVENLISKNALKDGDTQNS